VGMGEAIDLTDRWCRALARETVRWYAAQPDAQGWELPSVMEAVTAASGGAVSATLPSADCPEGT
jgi:hypothetical protein